MALNEKFPIMFAGEFVACTCAHAHLQAPCLARVALATAPLFLTLGLGLVDVADQERTSNVRVHVGGRVAPREPRYSRPLWQCSRSSRLPCAPCQPRDYAAATQALVSVPKAHTSALRVFQPGGGRPFGPKESPSMGSQKVTEEQGARKVHHDKRLASPLAKCGSRCQANDIRERFKFSNCPYPQPSGCEPRVSLLSSTLHRALRRMAGPVFLLVVQVLARAGTPGFAHSPAGK